MVKITEVYTEYGSAGGVKLNNRHVIFSWLVVKAHPVSRHQ